jgi:hypothetical protein
LHTQTKGSDRLTCWYSSIYLFAGISQVYSLRAIAKRCCKQFARQFSAI